MGGRRDVQIGFLQVSDSASAGACMGSPPRAKTQPCISQQGVRKQEAFARRGLPLSPGLKSKGKNSDNHGYWGGQRASYAYQALCELQSFV